MVLVWERTGEGEKRGCSVCEWGEWLDVCVWCGIVWYGVVGGRVVCVGVRVRGGGGLSAPLPLVHLVGCNKCDGPTTTIFFLAA